MTWASLEEVGRAGLFSDGDWVESKDQDPQGTVRLTQLADVGVGMFRDRSDRWMREDQASRLNCTFLEPGDVLIARMPDPIGRSCVVPPTIGRAVTAVDVAILRADTSSFEPAYVAWMINAPQFHMRVEALQSGTTRKRISRRNLSTLSIPRVSLSEQRRIVEILEEHLSHLDAAAADLTRANVRLESLSEAALQVLIPGDAVRRPLSEVLEVPLSNGRSVPSRDGGFPVLRLTALKEDGVDLEERKGGAWERAEAVRFLVKEGDFLIARGNGSLRLVGKGSLLRHEPDEVAFPDTAIRARARPSAVLPEFLSLVWNSRSTRDQIERVARTSAGIYKVNQSQLGAIQLPVPELSEQMSIVAAMSRLQEHRHVALETIDIATRRSHSLRRAVLAAAFEGKLTGRHTDVEVVEELAGA